MDTQRLAGTFVTLADTLVDDFDVVELLNVLIAECVDLLGASASGLMLADEHGRLRVAVASSERARLLELFQLQNDEGPCLESFRTGKPVGVERLDDEQARWPQFAAAAAQEGFVTVLALPMRLRGEVIGGLNLFGDSQSPPISEREVPIAQALADVATIAILQDRLARSREILADQLQVALNSRVTIEQAKGALATRLDIDPGEAFEMLRTRARTSRRRLVEVAEEVVRERAGAGWSG